MNRPEPSISDEYELASPLQITADRLASNGFSDLSTKSANTQPLAVVVTGLHVPFSQLLSHSIKLAIAAVPLVIIVTIAGYSARWWVLEWLAGH